MMLVLILSDGTHGTGNYTMHVPSDETRTVNANLSGNRRLVKTGDGTLVLNGNNTHEGGIDIQGGKVVVTNTNALGTQPTSIMSNFVTMTDNTILAIDSANKVVLNEYAGITLGDSGHVNTHDYVHYIDIESNNSTMDIRGPITNTRDSDILTLRTAGNSIRGTVRIRSKLDQSDFTNNIFELQVDRNVTLDVNDTVAPYNNVVIAGNVTSKGDIRGKGKINGNLIFDGSGRFLPGAEISTTMYIGGNLQLDPENETYISIRRNDNDSVVVDGDVTLDGKLLLIPFEDNLPSATRNMITLSSSDRYVTNNGWNESTIINYRDGFDNNGISLDSDSDYPEVNITTGSNGSVRLIKS